MTRLQAQLSLAVLAAALAATPAHAAIWSFTNNDTLTFNTGDTYPSSGIWTGYKYLNYGTINVQGDSMIGSTTATLTFYSDGWVPTYVTLATGGDGTEGTTTHTGCALNIGDATHNATLTVADVHPYVRVYEGNTINIAAGSTLKMVANTVGSTTSTHHAELANFEGTINYAGRIQFSPSHVTTNYNRPVINSYGTINLSDNPVLERLTNSTNQYPNESAGQIINWHQGTLSGSTTFTYLNSSGSANLDVATIINYGTISPGTSSSPGTLELENFSISNNSYGHFAFSIGGTDAGEFDQLILSGNGANLYISSVGYLHITTIDGFVPQDGDSWVLASVGSRSGAFTYFDVNGVSNPTGYTIQYNPTNITLLYGVPEPTSLALLAAPALLLLKRRR